MCTKTPAYVLLETVVLVWISKLVNQKLTRELGRTSLDSGLAVLRLPGGKPSDIALNSCAQEKENWNHCLKVEHVSFQGKKKFSKSEQGLHSYFIFCEVTAFCSCGNFFPPILPCF